MERCLAGEAERRSHASTVLPRIRFCGLEAKTPDIDGRQKWECNPASLAHHRPRQRGSAPPPGF